MRKTLAASASIAVALTVTLATVALADYKRDDSFGGDGLVTAGSDGADWFNDIVSVDGGYVVTGGWNNGRVVVAKYNEDGSTDTSFANEGRRIIKMGAYSQGLKVLPRPSGDFIVLGYKVGGFVLIGITEDGAINRDFGDRGIVKQNVDGVHLGPYATMDSQQRIVVATAEKTSRAFQTTRLHVWRFNKGGGIDRSFSGGTLTATPQPVNNATGIVTDDQDHIWLVTSQMAKGTRKTTGGSLLRIPEDGARVQTVRRFSVWDADGTYPVGIDRRADGAFLVGITGNTTGRAGVIALQPSGRNVQSYGDDGVVRARCIDLCYVFTQEMDADGALVMVGGVDTDTENRYVPDDTWVARFTAAGRSDDNFMRGWDRVIKLDRKLDTAYGVAVDDQGRVVLSGETGAEAYLMRLAEVT